MKYHKHIKKLLLISPVGFAVHAPEEIEDPMERFESQRRGPPMWILRIVKWTWEHKISLFKLGNLLGRRKTLDIISNKIIRDQISNEETKEVMTKYMYQIFARDGTTEYAI